jgi:hypothetical protein
MDQATWGMPLNQPTALGDVKGLCFRIGLEAKKTKPTILNGFLSQFLFNPSIESPNRVLGKSW